MAKEIVLRHCHLTGKEIAQYGIVYGIVMGLIIIQILYGPDKRGPARYRKRAVIPLDPLPQDLVEKIVRDTVFPGKIQAGRFPGPFIHRRIFFSQIDIRR